MTMVRAGLIIAGITLVLGTVGGFMVPLICIPCLALFAGAGAGYLSGRFDKPPVSGIAARRGAGAGAIGGVGALLAHLIAGVTTAVQVGPAAAAEMLESLGLAMPNGAGVDPNVYYASAFVSSLCLGLFEIALMAALGAVGGIIWYQTGGRGGEPAVPAL
jgi:hypothetical protein